MQMTVLRSWMFGGLLGVYTLYNLLWAIGITFSFGRNDTYQELLFVLLTFIVDIPILWFVTRRPKVGLTLFAVVLAGSIALGTPFHILKSLEVPAMWYGPKVILVAAAIWTYRSNRAIANSNRRSGEPSR